MGSTSASRRGVLGALATGVTTAIAGCSVSVGTTDLVVRNCRETTHTVAVTNTAVADERNHDSVSVYVEESGLRVS